MKRTTRNTFFFYLLLTVLGLSACLLLVANYDAHFSPAARAAKRTGRNLHLVHIGMDTMQVRQLLGSAEAVTPLAGLRQEQEYSYQHRPGTSGHHRLIIDSTGRVRQILRSEEAD